MTQRRGLAIGCGGALGLAWTAVALRVVEEQLNWDVRTADVLLGTSAGSEIVAALGSGFTPQNLVDALKAGQSPTVDPVLARHLHTPVGKIPPVPLPLFPGLGMIAAGIRRGSAYSALSGLLPRGRGNAQWLRQFGDDLAGAGGWVSHPATWIVAADARTGNRVAFGSPGAPQVDLGTALAASWAIPGWFPPVEVSGRRYVDGGAVSSVSADLLLDAGLDEVVVIAPMTTAGGVAGRGAARVERLLRGQMTAGLDREVAALRAAGIRVIRIEPGDGELSVMGPNFMDSSRREVTLSAARYWLPKRVAAALDRSEEN
ncbi:MAG: patatin [Rhodococcus sp.]|nr:patatin [Rhodococcus sp. (in: high G+C Gram-positive bacteria)]